MSGTRDAGEALCAAIGLEPALVRIGLASIFEDRAGIRVAVEGDAGSVIGWWGPHRADLAVVQLDAVAGDRLHRLRDVCDAHPDLRVAGFLSNPRRADMEEARGAGVEVFFCRQCTEELVLNALEAMRAGRGHICRCCCTVLAHESLFGGSRESVAAAISPREREVLGLIASGCTTETIARRLFISEKTVRTHRSRLMDKLGVETAAGLVVRAMETGVIALPRSDTG